MRADLRWRFWLIILLALISLVVLYPPLVAKIQQAFGAEDAKGFFNGQPIRQGLDLKGGLEVILGPDYRVSPDVLQEVETALTEKIGRMQVATPGVRKLGLLEFDKYEGLRFTFAGPEEARRVLEAGVLPETLNVEREGNTLHLELRYQQVGKDIEVTVTQSPKDFPEDALERAKIILSDRINRLGLSEPDIRLDKQHGRIIVQLPGVTSEKEAQEILQRTGRLNFRINGKPVMYGDDLKTARAGYDNGRVVIFFEFGKDGAARFRYLTEKYKGQYMAIHLDEEELMNPIIEEPILDGRGVIRMGRATIEEAKRYAVLMQAGALPISLRNLAVNQVAPTLGKEIIRQSLIAGVAGIVLVILFMLLFYGLMGALADLALVLYAALVLLSMALLRGVLTLPGVAGLILSIGMAVDANIIIFERIKDEIRMGKRVRPAVAAGFSRAFWTIFDSNLTTFIIALVLLFFGYGAVRGFAVTLSIGILVSMFTALFVTRLFLEMLIDRDPDRFLGHFGA
ncbi:MAG: protein translocase subunit SecD [Bacillota bacterium]